MKKSVLALAVAAGMLASAVSYADTTFYGSFRGGVLFTDPDSGDSNWAISDHGSRWGVRGAEDLGSGLRATYQLEARVNLGAFNQGFGGPAFGGRLLWLGLEGGFGAVRLGTQWSPYYIDVAGRMDLFNVVGIFDNNYSSVYRKNNSLLYQTPGSLDMFKFAAMINMDGPAGKRSIDEYNLGVTANFGPAGLGVAYLSNEVTDNDQWVVAADVGFGGAKLMALYEETDFEDHIQVYADYTFGNNILRGSWGRTDPDAGSSTDDWALGVQHNLSSRTRLWLEYGDFDDVAKQFSLGMRHDF